MNGFMMVVRNKLYFYPCKNTKRTQYIIDRFIRQLATEKGYDPDRYLADTNCRVDFKRRIELCNYERMEEHHHFEGKNWSQNIPVTEDECIVFVS